MQEKEAGTNFDLLSQSRKMIGQFRKTYSHTRENRKMFNTTSK